MHWGSWHNDGWSIILKTNNTQNPAKVPASLGSKSLWQDLSVALAAWCQVRAFASLLGSYSLIPSPTPDRSLFILAHHSTDTSYLAEPTTTPLGTCSLSFGGWLMMGASCLARARKWGFLWLLRENKAFLSRGGSNSGVEIANYSTNQLEQPVVWWVRNMPYGNCSMTCRCVGTGFAWTPWGERRPRGQYNFIYTHLERDSELDSRSYFPDGF